MNDKTKLKINVYKHFVEPIINMGIIDTLL